MSKYIHGRHSCHRLYMKFMIKYKRGRMMSELRKIIEGQISKQINEHIVNGRGKVVDHNIEANVANVAYTHPREGHLTLKNVPIRTNPGLHASQMRKGTDVYLEFIEGNMHQAIVVATADDAYTQRTRIRMEHKRKGAYVPDAISGRTEF